MSEQHGEQQRGPADHLRRQRWKPGQSGNPGGRPKGESITARLRAVLEKEHNGRVLMDLLAERLAKEALAGKFPFLKEVLDRLDGRVAERVNVGGEEGRALVINVVRRGAPRPDDPRPPSEAAAGPA
jgi:hypothetical protein